MSSSSAKRFPLVLSDVVRKPAGTATSAGGASKTAAGASRSALRAPAKAAYPVVPKAAVKAASKGSALAGTAARAIAGARAGAASHKQAGAPLTSERVRARMVERLAEQGISQVRVLDAFRRVPRHAFMEAGFAPQAYEDAALPIGHGQTISKPSVIARMLELVCQNARLDRVLEIGTGCGYQAALLAVVAREVYSIERVRALHERAKINLRPMRCPNIRLHYGDGRLGLPEAAPFDAIIMAAAGLAVPQALLEQLTPGGRLIAPVGGETQSLILIERIGAAEWRESRLERVFFVPLKSGVT